MKGRKDADDELVRCRLRLAKSKLDELQDGAIVGEAIQLAKTSRPVPEPLEQLSLLLALFKQLKAIFSSDGAVTEALTSLVYESLVPSLLPQGEITALLIRNLESSTKPNQLRAGDVLTAAERWSLVLPPPASSTSIRAQDNVLAPLFWSAVKESSRGRPNLVLLNTLAECVEWDDRLLELIKDLLDELASSSVPALVGSTIVALLAKFSASSPEAASKDIINIILPRLLEEDGSLTTTHLYRYVLPSFCGAHPDTFRMLLAEFNKSNTLPAWIALVSFGTSVGLVDIRTLPVERLQAGMGHADAAVQMKTLQLLTSPNDPIRLLNTDSLRLIKECMRLNSSISSVAMRTEYTAITHAFFSRFAQAEIVAQRNDRKRSKISESETRIEFEDPRRNLSEFKNWFLNDFVDPALQKCRHPPVARILVALIALQTYLDVLCGDDPAKAIVFSADRVQNLIACQASEYAEVRNRAMTILDAAPILPGYENLQTLSARNLLASAYTYLANPRKTQNEAATAALVIVFKKIVLPQRKAADSVAFVQALVDRSEVALNAAERAIANGEDLGLYGLIGAVRALIECVNMTAAEQSAWLPVFHRLRGIVERTWDITKRVVSLGPVDGDDDDEDDAPAHEIANAQRVLQDQSENGERRVDVRKLISGSWRATKEASELLSAIHYLPLNRLRNSQSIWSPEEIFAAGQQFLIWLQEIRHRGTFSKVAVAFGKLVEATTKVPTQQHLAAEWLHVGANDQSIATANVQSILKSIEVQHLSTTRRSAALPYAVLAIVTSEPSLLATAVDRLVALGDVDANTSDSTKVHAFNILKIVLLDSRNTKELDRFLENCVMLAVKAFSSPNWNVRNVGLILFSSLTHRALTPGRAGQDAFASRATLTARQTYTTWHAKYPRILPFVAEYLRDHQRSAERKIGHSHLFPVIIILRGLRWSPEPAALITELKKLVEPLLGNREWQVRKVAAQALMSLIEPSSAFPTALSIQPIAGPDLNMSHGRLLLLRHLLADVIDYSTLNPAGHIALESNILGHCSMHAAGLCPPLVESAMWCALTYQWQTTPALPSYRDSLETCAETILTNRRMQLRPGAAGARFVARFYLTMRYSSSNSTKNILSMLEKDQEEGSLGVALNALPGWSAPLSIDVFHRILEHALDTKAPEVARSQALDGLGGYWNPFSWDDGCLDSVLYQWEEILKGLEGVMQMRSVMMCEAALPALGWALASVCVSLWRSATAHQKMLGTSSFPPNYRHYAAIFADHLQSRAKPERSQPCRYSAVRALRHFTKFLCRIQDSKSPADAYNLVLHQVLMDLLQDDDEDIRIEAAKIVQQQCGLSEPISSATAARYFRCGLIGYAGTGCMLDRDDWLAWVVSMAVQRDVVDRELGQLETLLEGGKQEVELFEVEQSNLWRDSEEDMAQAMRMLESRPDLWEIAFREIDPIKLRIERLRTQTLETGISPIDDAWDALPGLERHKSIWSALHA